MTVDDSSSRAPYFPVPKQTDSGSSHTGGEIVEEPEALEPELPVPSRPNGRARGAAAFGVNGRQVERQGSKIIDWTRKLTKGNAQKKGTTVDSQRTPTLQPAEQGNFLNENDN